MAVIQGGVSGELQEVGEAAAVGGHVIEKPDDYGALGHYRISMLSGTIAAALAANSELFQFRWVDGSRLAVIHKLWVSAGMNVAPTAAGLFALRLAIARGWSADGSGGTLATLTGNNQKDRTSMGTTLLGSARMATTVALGAGTKTIDAQDVGTIATGLGTGAITTAVKLPIFDQADLVEITGNGQHPIVLAQNEGLVVRSGPIAPAAMTWHLAVTVAWAELTAY
jgi:hypothetical protein